jgi:hypothetical protein
MDETEIAARSTTMKTDIYTKTMLTVIAACLIYLCLGRPAVLSTAQAQTAQTHVIIDGWSWGTDNAVMQPIESHPLPVRVMPQR